MPAWWAPGTRKRRRGFEDGGGWRPLPLIHFFFLRVAAVHTVPLHTPTFHTRPRQVARPHSGETRVLRDLRPRASKVAASLASTARGWGSAPAVLRLDAAQAPAGRRALSAVTVSGPTGSAHHPTASTQPLSSPTQRTPRTKSTRRVGARQPPPFCTQPQSTGWIVWNGRLGADWCAQLGDRPPPPLRRPPMGRRPTRSACWRGQRRPGGVPPHRQQPRLLWMAGNPWCGGQRTPRPHPMGGPRSCKGRGVPHQKRGWLGDANEEAPVPLVAARPITGRPWPTAASTTMPPS